MEFAARLRRDIDGIDRDGRRPALVDPSVDPEFRTPGHHHGEFLGRRHADRLDDLGLARKHDLARHLRRNDLASQLGRLHILEIEAQVDPSAAQVQALRQRQDSRTGESPGERGAGVERLDLGQGVSAQRPGAVGLPLKLVVIEEDVMTVLRDPDVDRDPLHAIGDQELQHPRGVPRRRVHRAVMGHHLDRAGRLDRLEEREAWAIGFRPRGRGTEHDSPQELDGHGESSPLHSQGIPTVALEPVRARTFVSSSEPPVEITEELRDLIEPVYRVSPRSVKAWLPQT